MRPQDPTPLLLGQIEHSSGVGLTAYTASLGAEPQVFLTLPEACEWLLQGQLLDYPLVFVGQCLRRIETTTEIGENRDVRTYPSGPLTGT